MNASNKMYYVNSNKSPFKYYKGRTKETPNFFKE